MRLIVPILWLVVQGAHASQGPAESAIDFVKKLETGQVDLNPAKDTAIVSEISPGKKESILQRLQRLAMEIKGDEVEIGPTKIEGSLAGVILRMVNPKNPAEIQVIPLAMVQDDGTWRAAPVPASFENTIAPHTRATREVARKLEVWLAREQINEVERLRKQADSLLRESLAKSLPPETLRSWSEDQAVEAFLDACAKREIPRILALMGGLSSPQPDGWQAATAALRNAITAPAPEADSWTLLTCPVILRSMQERMGSNDSGGAEYQLLCMDPRKENPPALHELLLTVSRGADGLWSVSPVPEPQELAEDDITEKTAALFSDRSPLRPLSSARELKNALLASFQTMVSPYGCLSYMHRNHTLESDFPRFQQAVLMRWQTINPALPTLPLELGFHEDGDHAYLAMQWLPLGKLVYSAKVFHLQKGADGWVWNSTPDKDTSEAAEAWVRQNEATWKKTFIRQAVQDCATPDLTLPVPSEADAIQVVSDWLDALAASDWEKALKLCARLGGDRSPAELLRNLGYECKSSRMSATLPLCELIARGSAVTLVGARALDKDRALVSLLPVVATSEGARILLEIDLGDPARPGRAFLNRNALDRLQDEHPKMADELRAMLAKLPDGKENPSK